ncbi:hypothetical protein V2J09_009931, partial [Rumex salicifolius]
CVRSEGDEHGGKLGGGDQAVVVGVEAVFFRFTYGRTNLLKKLESNTVADSLILRKGNNVLAYQQARDTFYACLKKESKKRATEIASVGLLYPIDCNQSRVQYENACRPSWVKHFDRQYCSKKRVERLLDDNVSKRELAYMTDLSNIVRRRGYKAVRDLLANSVCSAGMNSPLHFEDDATGEEKKMKDLTQETSKQDRFEGVGYCSGLILLDPNTFAQGWRNGQRSMESSLSLRQPMDFLWQQYMDSVSLSVKELWTKHKSMEEIRSDEPKKVLKVSMDQLRSVNKGVLKRSASQTDSLLHLHIYVRVRVLVFIKS